AIDNCTGSIIGGTTTAERNVIAGSGLPTGGFSGISLSNNSNSTLINGNYIGFLADGIMAAGNSQHGIWSLNSTTITIMNNVIGNNGYGTNDGSGIFLGNSATIATIQGNIIGLDKNGTQRRGNKMYGIDLNNANNAQVGGTMAALRNIISGNDNHGVFVEAGSSNAVFEGNFIGTDINGTGASGALGNGTTGIQLDGGSLNCRIGGTAYSQRNIISGNGRLFVYGVTDGSGVKVLGASTGLVFKGNFVGLEKNGTTALANAEMGLSVEGGSNNAIIGGATAPERNVVSAHGYHGIQFRDGDNADISGNYIGTDSTGLISRGNNASGVILIFATNVNIGKALSGTGNLISNNHEMGIHIIGGNTITIYNNLIGVASNGTSAMGNFDGGIRVFGVGGGVWNGRAVVIGGTAALQANTIAYSTGGNGSTAFGNGYGVGIIHNDYGRFNPVVGNKIYCNATKGIELGAGSTFTGNPSIGASTQAGNIGKIAPVITLRSTTSISGTALNGDVIHVYKNTTIGAGCGCEGETYLGTTTTGGAGTWSFTFAPALTAAEVPYVTVTATDANNNTSEFNCNIAALPIRLILFTVAPADDNSVQALWETSSEQNNKYFVLERSADGSNFESIGTINGSGTSAEINSYSFYDSDHPAGLLYYRLKQVDNDGSFTYSAIRSIYFKDKKYITLGPNPADEKVNVLFFGYSEKDYVKITIVSSLGETVASYDHYLDSNIISFDLTGLAPAVYFVNISAEDKQISKKLIIE
ncbi:MAG TPA: T9SS type A sorting domain-containing protein, partial [Cytophagaceae bacterium]|nr:T9SS type A sorting domain-containing protein [Cytophagaceae bacterium]